MPFVSFEGIDGSGKTTQSWLLAEWLEGRGHQVLRTKEPDGGRLGREVRAVLTKPREFHLDPIEEMLLIAAARYDHVRSVIRPALAAGTWVLSDRFDDSTFALQVHRNGLPQNLFPAVTTAVVDGTRPDMTFILDMPPPEALARRTTRGGDLADPAEVARDFERIRDGFRTLSAREPSRCKLIDALQPEAAVAEAVRRELRAARLLTD